MLSSKQYQHPYWQSRERLVFSFQSSLKSSFAVEKSAGIVKLCWMVSQCGFHTIPVIQPCYIQWFGQTICRAECEHIFCKIGISCTNITTLRDSWATKFFITVLFLANYALWPVCLIYCRRWLRLQLNKFHFRIHHLKYNELQCVLTFVYIVLNY